MKSMTGFGFSAGKIEETEVTVSVKTVNGRFLDLRIHAPRELMSIESQLRKIAESHFGRGTVDIFVARKVTASQNLNPIVNENLLGLYVKNYKAIAKKLKLKYTPSVESLMRLPEVMTIEVGSVLQTEEQDLIIQLVKEACQKCEAERSREGKSLQKNLSQLIGDLGALVSRLKESREAVNSTLQEKLELKLQNRLKTLEIPVERITQEVAILADKADISEELVRLDEHLTTLQKFIQQSSVEGKKLDFYTQELLREVNTIGSKSPVVSMTQLVVDSKTIIEKMKEQVQNIQ